MKILIADDEYVTLMKLKKTLDSWGYDVLTAENGLQAWDVFQKNDVDIVIMDWMMPGMDGIELCQKIREHAAKRYVFIVILTIREQTGDVIAGFEAGADNFITKPFNREELRSRLNAGMRVLELENTLRKKNRLLEKANHTIMEDLKCAAKVQADLLPNRNINIKGVDIQWHFAPCRQLGGDMLNVLRLDEHRYGIYVLDVSGHGVSAALFSVALSHLLSERGDILKRSIPDPPYYHVTPPKKVLESLNRQFPMDADAGQYFTILYGILDASELTFQWSNAGHPPPIMMDGDMARVLSHVGAPPIGFFEDTQYPEGLLKLKPRDRILLYSDGIVEAMNQLGEQFTVDRVKGIIEGAGRLSTRKLCSRLISKIEEWTKVRGGPDDDMTLLGLDVL